MRAASTSPQRTRSSMQYLRWSVTYGFSFHEGMPSSSITSRRQVFKKFRERAVELTGPFDVRDVARAFDDYETRALDPFTHRLGVDGGVILSSLPTMTSVGTSINVSRSV